MIYWCTTAPLTLPCSTVVQYIYCYTSIIKQLVTFSTSPLSIYLISIAPSRCLPHTTCRYHQRYSSFLSVRLPAERFGCATPLHQLLRPPHTRLCTLPAPLPCILPSNSVLLLPLPCALSVPWIGIPHCQPLSVHCHFVLTRWMLFDQPDKVICFNSLN